PGRHLRPGSGGRGFHRGAGHFGGYGGYGPGYYDSALYVIVPGGEPEERREPAERSIPVAVGIQRPPAADPVIYRIENHRGGQVARVIRIGAEGITPAYGGRTVPAGRR
ncbi:hypothetical protein, partial [Bosea sp. (in: a-proteobacteria)]|uniref:hypothetical protein n=1 Tax=Bosea sp. (in: a-proteobacteria) TaxID=1871050 RepID=UPI002FCA8671